VRLDKVKRPAGVFAFDMHSEAEDAAGVWLYYPAGSSWRAPHDMGTMPFDALLLLTRDRPFVTRWVDDASDRRIEIDICLPPLATDTGWSFVDLELDPVRHELTGAIEVEDADEFHDACRHGWISEDEATIARAAAADMEGALARRTEPWGDAGWRRLDRIRTRA
jgi:hypothetical protein